MKKRSILITLIAVYFIIAVLLGCADSVHTQNHGLKTVNKQSEEVGKEETMDRKMVVNVDGNDFIATLANSEAADRLMEMMCEKPVTLQMRDYSGFEKVGTLETNLPTSNRQITTQPGDIMLYQGNQIVIFYGSNSWSYTRLGKIDDLNGWEDALGGGEVRVTFLPK